MRCVLVFISVCSLYILLQLSPARSCPCAPAPVHAVRCVSEARLDNGWAQDNLWHIHMHKYSNRSSPLPPDVGRVVV